MQKGLEEWLKNSQRVLDLLDHKVPDTFPEIGPVIVKSPALTNAVRLLEEQDTDQPHTATLFAVAEIYAWALWAQHGWPIFRLTENLAAALLLTDAPVQPPSFPFPAFMLQLPDEVLPIGPRCPVVWSRYLLMARLPENDSASIWIHTHSMTFDSAQRRKLPLDKWETFPDEMPADLYGTTTHPLQMTQHRQHLLLQRFINNLLAWLDASGTLAQAPKPEPRKRRRGRRRGRRPWPKVWLVGSEVKIAPELRTAAKAFSVGNRDDKHWKLRMQHIVRGHWKLQVVGPQRAQRKRIWIEPYLRGPDSKIAWSRVYETETE